MIAALILTTLAVGQEAVRITEPDTELLLEAYTIGCSPDIPCIIGLTKNRVGYVFGRQDAIAVLPNRAMIPVTQRLTSSTALYRRSAVTKVLKELKCPTVEMDKDEKGVAPSENDPHCHMTYHFDVDGHERVVQFVLHDPNQPDQLPDHVLWSLDTFNGVHREQCRCHMPI